jgi:hypothetical protein
MNEDEKRNDIVDTTDCLEAVSAFKAMKNFLFLIIIICLLLLQGAFWLDYTGFIDKTEAEAVCPVVAAETPGPAAFDAETIDAQARRATEDIVDKSKKPNELVATNAPCPKIKVPVIGVYKGWRLVCLIKSCNFILIIAATLYCFTLLVSIKISLVGRLGGINHISRAFFLSLFALVILLPWQKCFGGIIAGAIYAPEELFQTLPPAIEASLIGQILYYLRFTGLWLVATLLIIFAQFRSIRWTKATLRRLGILR